MRLSDENLRGRTVISADGLAVGEVALLFLDPATLTVESIQVRLRKEIADRLGADRTFLHPATLEIPARIITSVGDAVLLSTKADELRQVVGNEGEPAPAT